MSFSLEISPAVMALLSVTALCAVTVLSVYCPFIRRVARRRRVCEQMQDCSAEGGLPGASIIVYSQDEAEPLERLLPTIMSQDYPAGFEVIVVNEGDSVDVRNVVGAMQSSCGNLYLTHTPDGARALSRKKLALTLGIKAARFEVVVLTTVAARIESCRWLMNIMRHFSDRSIGIVLGYGAPVDGGDHGAGARHRAFDFTADNVAWLSSAIGRRPYRGTELNLAYRRELFFANKGFSRSLNLHFGDDDIFVSEIVSRDNTVVELSAGSIVRFDSYDYAKTMRDTALRHRFTERFIRRRPLSRLMIGEISLWACVITAVAAILLDRSNAVTVAVAVLLPVGSLVAAGMAWRKAMNALATRRLCLTLPWLAMTRPLRRIMLAMQAKFIKQKKYTWD